MPRREPRRDASSIAEKVRAFYEVSPFPAFDIAKYADADALRERASPYALLLDRQIPHNAAIADVGCGTGQLAALLALRQGRRVTAVDLSPVSLSYGRALQAKLGLANLTYAEDDAMSLSLPSDAYDVVLCNGVLHHTSDPERGFEELVRISKRGGFVIVGLYHRYGRAIHSLVRWLSHHLGPVGPRLASAGIRRMLGTQYERGDLEKLRTWTADQFAHPHESVHTAREVLGWFDRHGLDHAASLPPIEFGRSEADVILLPRRVRPPTSAGSLVGAFLRELTWAWTQRWTGGYFVMVGRKR